MAQRRLLLAPRLRVCRSPSISFGAVIFELAAGHIMASPAMHESHLPSWTSPHIRIMLSSIFNSHGASGAIMFCCHSRLCEAISRQLCFSNHALSIYILFAANCNLLLRPSPSLPLPPQTCLPSMICWHCLFLPRQWSRAAWRAAAGGCMRSSCPPSRRARDIHSR